MEIVRLDGWLDGRTDGGSLALGSYSKTLFGLNILLLTV